MRVVHPLSPLPPLVLYYSTYYPLLQMKQPRLLKQQPQGNAAEAKATKLKARTE